MPGGNGQINAGPERADRRSRAAISWSAPRESYRGRGLAVMITDADTNLAAAVDCMAQIKRPVTVIATSRGTAARRARIAAGARPDALVLTSGFLLGCLRRQRACDEYHRLAGCAAEDARHPSLARMAAA